MTEKKYERPRLLVLASTYPRWVGDHEPGFVHDLSMRLVGEFDVVVLCPHSPGAALTEVLDGVKVVRYRYAPEALEKLIHDGGLLGNLKRSPWKVVLLPAFLAGQVLATARLIHRFKPEVIHAHWIVPQALVAIAGAWLARVRVPILATSHGADLYSLKAWPFRLLKRFVLRRVAAVTVVSQAMKQAVLALCGVDRVEVEPMGVDLQEKFTPDAKIVRVPGKALFVGRIVEKKGVRHLLEAWPKVLARRGDATLDIVGFGPLQAELQRVVIERGLERSVRFVGPVPHDRLPGFYRQAKVLVVPFIAAAGGDQEGLGLVMVEAIGCGCPVVAGNVPAVLDVLGGRPRSGTITAVDPESLSGAIVEALDSGEANPADVQSFDWQSRAAAYARLLRDIVQAPKR